MSFFIKNGFSLPAKKIGEVCFRGKITEEQFELTDRKLY
jgi:hypothetical protein